MTTGVAPDRVDSRTQDTGTDSNPATSPAGEETIVHVAAPGTLDAGGTMINSGPNLLVASTSNRRVAMPRVERETLLNRISELQLTLGHTRSEDLRKVLEQTLADCIIRLAELDEILGIETASPVRS